MLMDTSQGWQKIGFKNVFINLLIVKESQSLRLFFLDLRFIFEIYFVVCVKRWDDKVELNTTWESWDWILIKLTRRHHGGWHTKQDSSIFNILKV